MVQSAPKNHETSSETHLTIHQFVGTAFSIVGLQSIAATITDSQPKNS